MRILFLFLLVPLFLFCDSITTAPTAPDMQIKSDSIAAGVVTPVVLVTGSTLGTCSIRYFRIFTMPFIQVDSTHYRDSSFCDDDTINYYNMTCAVCNRNYELIQRDSLGYGVDTFFCEKWFTPE
jgi:hypothetical protein